MLRWPGLFLVGTLKTIKQEEPITRSRFIDCPHCKTRGLKLKRIVQVGRCRNCHESYKIIIQFVKTGSKKQKETVHTHTFETREKSESNPLSWQVPSDNSLFGSTSETSPSFGEQAYGWEQNNRDNQSQTGSEQ